MTSNVDSSVSFKLCLNSWECCHAVSPVPPLTSAATMNSEEPHRLEKDCALPSKSSKVGEEVRWFHGNTKQDVEYFRVNADTSGELCSKRARAQMPAGFPRVVGLATGHDRDRLYLHSCWSKVKLPADSSCRRAFCPSQVRLKKCNHIHSVEIQIFLPHSLNVFALFCIKRHFHTYCY